MVRTKNNQDLNRTNEHVRTAPDMTDYSRAPLLLLLLITRIEAF